MTDNIINNNFITPIFKNICFIHPNQVTLINLFSIIPIFFNLKNKGKMKHLLLYTLLNRYLDNLDGYIARNCNKKTQLGASLDIICDTILSSIIIVTIIINKLKKPLKRSTLIILFVLVIIQLYTLYIVFIQLKTKSYLNKLYDDDKLIDKVTIFYRNNSTIFGLILMYLIKKFNTLE